MLAAALDKVSGAHLKNSADLKNRIQNLDISDKKLMSFDIKSLFTNVPINDELRAVKKVLETIDANNLPVNKSDYLKLVSTCVKYNTQRKRVQTTCRTRNGTTDECCQGTSVHRGDGKRFFFNDSV